MESTLGTTCLSDGEVESAFLDHGLLLHLDEAFALQLQEIFGPVSYGATVDLLMKDDLAVSIDFDFATTIYSKFIRCLENTSSVEDETDAAKLQAEASEALDEEGKGVPTAFHRGLELRLPMQFVLQLQEVLHPKNNPPELTGDDMVINLDLKLAKEIHCFWSDTFKENFTKEGLLEMVLNDEETRQHIHFEDDEEDVSQFYTEDGSVSRMVLDDEAIARALQEDEDEQYHDGEKFRYEKLQDELQQDEQLARRSQEVENRLHAMEQHVNAGLPILDGSCICKNADKGRFWEIFSHTDGKFLGICCKKRKCQQEYFVEIICTDEEDAKDPYTLRWKGVRLLKKSAITPAYNQGFQANLTRERIYKICSLKIGDHIMWSRKYVIWHHAVVTKVCPDSFDAINWNTARMMRMKIREESFNSLSRVFRVNYQDVYTGVKEDLHRMLAVSRAYSRLHGKNNEGRLPTLFKLTDEDNTDYALFNANCEHFASYCILGKGVCHQSLWALLTTTSTITNNMGKSAAAAAAFAAEFIENLAKAPEIVGASVLVVIELLSFICSWFRLRKLYRSGELTRKVFVQEVGKRLGGFLFGAGLGAAVGVLLMCCPPAELICTPIVALIGKVCGEQVGFEAAFQWTECWDTDEKHVKSVKDLKMGDHIVQMGWFWSRTHGVFISEGEIDNHIKAVMFHGKAVKLQEIPMKDIRLIIYSDKVDLADSDTVVARAYQFIEDPEFQPPDRERQVYWCKTEHRV